MIVLRVGIQLKPPLLQTYILPSGPSAAPLGPPSILATTSLRPSGQTRVNRCPRISTSTTEPSGITTGPSGNSRPVARTRTLDTEILPLLAAGGFLHHSARATLLLRLLWQSRSGLPSNRRAGQPSGAVRTLTGVKRGPLVCARSAQKSANSDHGAQTRCEAAAHRQGIRWRPKSQAAATSL